MYHVICMGVNQGPTGNALRYAEKDAEDVATLFRGVLSPPTAQVKTLIGSEATAQALEFELLLKSLVKPPKYLVLYFSGHGGPDGILTSSGLLPYETLVESIRGTSIPFVTVILDVCFAASYLGFLKEARLGGLAKPRDLRLQWLFALASATPGSRLIFSTGATALSREASEFKNGVFTHFFLSALRRCRGDIRFDSGAWISDQRAFVATKRAVERYSNGEQIPVERGLTGDFPLVLSQAEEPLGTANFCRAVLESGTLNVNFAVEERSGLHTTIRWRLLNPDGDEIAADVHQVLSTDTSDSYRGSFEFPHAEARADETTRLHRVLFDEARLEWILTLEDDHGHVLDEKVVPIRFRK